MVLGCPERVGVGLTEFVRFSPEDLNMGKIFGKVASNAKKAGTKKLARLQCWLVARINLNLRRTLHHRRNEFELYALLRGRTVISRTCVRMLDICIPFSCETKGKSSEIN